MKRVGPDDIDMRAIELLAKESIIIYQPVPNTENGRNIIAGILYEAAQRVCPQRRLSFTVTCEPINGRNALVDVFEIEPHMSRENPYQSQSSMDTYAWMLRGLVQAKLETFLGPYYKPTTTRPTRNEYVRRQVRTLQPFTHTITCRNHSARR